MFATTEYLYSQRSAELVKPQRGRELETLQVINKQTPPALQPPPLNQEGELEAMATKKLSLFCNLRFAQEKKDKVE